MSTVKFWITIDGKDKRVTLSPWNSKATFNFHGRTDEGCCSVDREYTYVNGKVYMKTVTRSVDCDGRLYTTTTRVWDSCSGDTINKLGKLFPVWSKVDNTPDRQRDYEAEKAGY